MEEKETLKEVDLAAGVTDEELDKYNKEIDATERIKQSIDFIVNRLNKIKNIVDDDKVNNHQMSDLEYEVSEMMPELHMSIVDYIAYNETHKN